MSKPSSDTWQGKLTIKAMEPIQPSLMPNLFTSTSTSRAPSLFTSGGPSLLGGSVFESSSDDPAAILASNSYFTAPHGYSGNLVRSNDSLPALNAYTHPSAFPERLVPRSISQPPPTSVSRSGRLLDFTSAQSQIQMHVFTSSDSYALEHCTICLLPTLGKSEEETVCRCFVDPTSY